MRIKGFTLVEMMVVVAILAIVATVALPDFSAWIANQRLNAKAESLAAGLNVARTEALKRSASVSVAFTSSNGMLDGGWNVCPADKAAADGTCAAGDLIDSRKGENTTDPVDISPAGAFMVTFTSLGTAAAKDVAGDDRISALDIKSEKTSEIRRVEISTGGRINVCKPNATGYGAC